jgi:hypothetical protein
MGPSLLPREDRLAHSNTVARALAALIHPALRSTAIARLVAWKPGQLTLEREMKRQDQSWITIALTEPRVTVVNAVVLYALWLYVLRFVATWENLGALLMFIAPYLIARIAAAATLSAVMRRQSRPQFPLGPR